MIRNDYIVKKECLLEGCSKKEKDFAENKSLRKYHSLILKVQVKNPP